jgi:hypothetical protein
MSEPRSLHLLGTTDTLRTGVYQGREHVVIPLVALVESVIRPINSEFNEYVPMATLSKAVHGWNGRPVVLGHPAKDGAQISANDPGVLDERQLGSIFNTRMLNGKLTMEAWVDPALVTKLGGAELMRRLERMTEVSVGAYVALEKTSGKFQGQDYQGIWKEIGPDHLALLPDSVGACSIEMGCGTHRAAAAYLVTADGKFRAVKQWDQASRDALPKADFAGPDQTYPIADASDVGDAWGLAGHAEHPDEVRHQIIAIAKRKGLMSGLPETAKEFMKTASRYTEEEITAAGGPGSGPHGGKQAVGTYHTLNKPGHPMHGHVVQVKKQNADGTLQVKSQRSSDRRKSDGTGPVTRSTAAAPSELKRLEGEPMEGKSIKERFLALVAPFVKALEDEEPPDEEEETAETITYKNLMTLLEQASASLTAGTEAVKALSDSDLPDDVEDAHLEALISMALQVYGTMNGVIKSATSCLSDNDSDGPMAYMEQRAAAGARHSANDLKMIQDTHDTAVKLGATCTKQTSAETGLKAACGCGGSIMTKDSRVAAIKALIDNPRTGWKATDQVALDAMPDLAIESMSKLATAELFVEQKKTIRAIRAAAVSKTPADQLVQNKVNADAALAAHAHGLNAQDAVDAQKKTDKMNQALEDAKAGKGEDEEDEPKDAARRAAAAAGTGAEVKPQTEEEYLKTAPDSIKTLVADHKARQAARRTVLVTQLKTAQKVYSEKDLTDMPMEQLEKTAQLTFGENFDKPDYSGQGGHLETAEGGDKGDVYANPPDPFAKALEARRASRASGKTVN